jgi:hypothetical protein
MAIIPGSGASISPVFNDDLGVDSVIIIDGGSGYDPDNPPVLSIGNAGTPTRAAVLEPVIVGGKIVAIKVLDSGEGYNPLRVELTPDVPVGEDVPDPAAAKIILKENGEIDYIQVTKNGDKHFYDVDANVLGAVGGGAIVRAVSKAVTGLSILNTGRDYETPPFLSITGGGGSGATGAAEIDAKGIVSSNVTISNSGQFYLDAPYVLFVGGGGLGAKGKAIINQGSIQEIVVTNPGYGYTSPPSVVFARKAKLKRKSRNRQSYDLEVFQLSGITKNIGRSDTSIYLSNTDPYSGSGVVLLEKELIRYTGKDANRLTGCTRGLNFRYDQRVVLDNTQNDPETGISAYEFNIGDRVIRTQESATSKIAIVYDWRPETRELFVVFRIDELAFIDAGTPGEKSAVVFDGGIAESSDTFELPHVIIDTEGSIIYRLTDPPSVLVDKAFEDDDELDGAGDGYPDLVNTGTAYNNQINLDSGNASTLYGIEETTGGTNTTLFESGDQIKDSSVPFKIATVSDAGGLNEGVSHDALIQITMDMRNANNYNGIDFTVGETITGVESLIEATVVSWDPNNHILVVEDPVPYDTADPLKGILYEFSSDSTIVDIRVLDTGNGYSTPITVNIPDSIVDADATAQLTADQITSLTVGSGGYGYQTAPTITFTSGSGSGGVVQAILGGEKVTGDNGGSWRILSIDYLTRVRNDEF